MNEKRVSSIRDYLDVITRHHPEWQCWYYRGHSHPGYKLLPKVGREPFAPKPRDQVMFEKWKRHAVAYITAGPVEFSEWDWLAIAQHHGLATRLLDWTFNPLAAAFFALVESNNSIDESHDSVVWAHYSRSSFIDTGKKRNPFATNGIHRVAPSSVIPRIGRQGGIFTVHGPPSNGLDRKLPTNDKLERIVISGQCKMEFAIQLSHYGVNRLSLFPDLDGLSAHINWSFEHLPYE